MSSKPVDEKLNPLSTTDAAASDRLQFSAAISRFFNSRMRLGQLRLLAAIAEQGVLRRVADSLHITPSAVSKQVTEIEDALQHPVLIRVGNRLQFTPLGELLARRSADILTQIERTRIEVDELCSGAAGAIGVGAVPTVAPLFMSALLSELKNRAPNAAIRLYEDYFEVLGSMLEDGAVDLVLARETTHPLEHDFEQVEVMADPLSIVCGSHHPLARRSRLAWQDLRGTPWILPFKGSSTFMHLESLLLRHGLTIPPGSVESRSWTVNAALLQKHAFVTLFPLTYARKYVPSSGLAMLPLSTEGMQGTIKAVWRRDNRNPIVPLLVEAVRRHAVLL